MRDLSKAELGIWLGHQSSSDPTLYNCAELVRFSAGLELNSFELALRNVLRQADVLNERFFEHQGLPKAERSQPVDSKMGHSGPLIRHVELPPALFSVVTGLPHANESQLRTAALKHTEVTFALSEGHLSEHTLFVTDNRVHAWLHVAHHLALDGFGFRLVSQAVAVEYTALLSKQHTGQHFRSLTEVLTIDSAYQNSAAHEQDRAFFANAPWRRYPSAILAPYERGHGAAPNGEHSAIYSDTHGAIHSRAQPGTPARPLRVQTQAPTHLFTQLQDTARAWRASWPEITITLIAHFIARESRQSRFVLGVPVMLRLGTPKAKVPCMAMNIARVPFIIHAQQRPSETLEQLRHQWKAQSPHHRFRYEELGPMGFGQVVNVLPFSEEPTFGSVTSSSSNLLSGPVGDLALMVAPRAGSLELTADGHPALFTREALERLSTGLLDSLSTSSSANLKAPLATRERALDGPQHPDVLALLRQAASAFAHNVALSEGDSALSYGTLWTRVQTEAAQLRAQLEDGRFESVHRIVVLDLPRGADALCLLLAVLESGACYAFLDPDQPLQRRAALLQQLHPDLLITLAPDAWRAQDVKCPVVTPHELRRSVNPRPTTRPALDPTDPAYIVFTSGSTGTPKAVTISRSSVSAFVNGARKAYPIHPSDRVLQFAPLTFDASVEEVLCTLCAGATLVLRNAAMLDSMQAFAATCDAWAISVLDLPTAFWHEWMEAAKNTEARAPRSLRLVLIGGEAADADKVVTFRDWAKGARLVNTYGPSEATVVATYADLTEVSLATGVPIGTALCTVSAHVVDERSRLLTGVAEGELCLSGPQLATGYLDQPKETNAKFVRLGESAFRAYRTGDRVRRGLSGELYFIGRIDDELKLSGYRISPEEVEAALNSHPDVARSVVTALKRAGQPVLTAHIELTTIDDSSEVLRTLADQEVRTFLLKRLPAPMVPTRYVFHQRLPVTKNGKLDRRGLATFETTSPVVSQTFEAPFDAEPGRTLLATWREILGRPHACADDDFFRLGGHSLQVIQLASRLNPLHPDITVSAIFRYPTPRRLLAFVRKTAMDASAPYDAVMPLDMPAQFSRPSNSNAIADVLLTGGTGFVGANLLSELLHRNVRVRCIVRAESKERAHGKLVAALKTHGCEVNERQLLQLDVVALDLAEPPPQELWPSVLGFARCVLHCAASVNLTRSFTSLTPDNITSTRWLLQYAHGVGASVCYVSTLAVARANADSSSIPEALDEAHTSLADGYQQSKWHAEQLCKHAAERGVDVQIVRLGRVTGSTRNSAVNPNDIVWRIARAATRCGFWPNLPFTEVWTPVDTVSHILAELTVGTQAPKRSDSALRVVHVAHQGVVALTQFHRRLLAAGYELVPCDVHEWLTRVRVSADTEDLATVAFFELMTSNAPGPSQAPFECAHLLSALPNLDRAPLSDRNIDQYIESAIRSAILPPPSPLTNPATHSP